MLIELFVSLGYLNIFRILLKAAASANLIVSSLCGKRQHLQGMRCPVAPSPPHCQQNEKQTGISLAFHLEFKKLRRKHVINLVLDLCQDSADFWRAFLTVCTKIQLYLPPKCTELNLWCRMQVKAFKDTFLSTPWASYRKPQTKWKRRGKQDVSCVMWYFSKTIAISQDTVQTQI